jgi:hypothetical protein
MAEEGSRAKIGTVNPQGTRIIWQNARVSRQPAELTCMAGGLDGGVWKVNLTSRPLVSSVPLRSRVGVPHTLS